MLDLAPHHKRGLALAHPWLNASGILGFAGEGRGLIEFAALGAFVTNALTWTPRTPAHAPNVVDVQTGLVLHTGLPNPGVRAAVRRYAREWARLGCPVIVHLAATSPADVARAIELLERTDSVSGVELGVRDDVTADELTQLTRAAVGGPPLIVRLPLLRAAELSAAAAGADALTVGAPIRLTVQLDNQTVDGRFYGPDVFQLAQAALQTVASQALDVPLIGAGGIFSAEDARTLLASGATAVQADAVWWRAPQFYQALS
jgi:dihydroorotate dehydrogenase (NAD+) catalytic subunit